MPRYLLVLDTGLPIRDEELYLGPISHLAARHGKEPTEVVVLSLASSPRGSTMELLLGAGISIATVVPVLPARRGQITTSVPPRNTGCTGPCST